MDRQRLSGDAAIAHIKIGLALAVVAIAAIAGATGVPATAAGQANLLLTNGRIHAEAEPQAIAVTGSVISYVGSQQGADAHTGPETVVIDLERATLLPGFIDNHVHLGEGGEVRCFPVYDRLLSDQTRLLRRCARGIPEGAWIIGYGGDYLLEMEEGDTAPLAVLDKAFPDHPTIIMDFVSHAQFVNSRAYELAGIDVETEDPPAAPGESDDPLVVARLVVRPGRHGLEHAEPQTGLGQGTGQAAPDQPAADDDQVVFVHHPRNGS